MPPIAEGAFSEGQFGLGGLHPGVRQGGAGARRGQRLLWPAPWEAEIEPWGHGCPGRGALPAHTGICIRETDRPSLGRAGLELASQAGRVFGREGHDWGILPSTSDSFF